MRQPAALAQSGIQITWGYENAQSPQKTPSEARSEFALQTSRSRVVNGETHATDVRYRSAAPAPGRRAQIAVQSMPQRFPGAPRTHHRQADSPTWTHNARKCRAQRRPTADTVQRAKVRQN